MHDPARDRFMPCSGPLIFLVPEGAPLPISPEPGASVIRYIPGQTLAQAVYLSGLYQPPVLCSGLALCGRCRVRIMNAPPAFPADAERFSPQEISRGWRLGCRHFPAPGMLLELPESTRPFTESLARPDPALRATNGTHMLAMDLGTTSLQWRRIVRLSSDAPPLVLQEGSLVNPQMGAGSDVISRLAAAATPEGKHRLRELTLAVLRALAGPREEGGIAALCLAANPAMTSIALGLDTATLATAPYSLAYKGGRWENLPGLPPLWVPPQLSPFVGGDISAGYASLAMNPALPPPPCPFLLADLGTNGEFLLALGPDDACSASVALGPALEGAGLSQGTEARPGAINRFTLSPKGLEAHCLPSSHPLPLPGITGTGYISLLHTLRNSNAVSPEGRFHPERSGPLQRFFKLSPAPGSGEPCLELPLGLRLSAGDVEELLKVKAAFSLGLQRLLAYAGLHSRDLSAVFLAGALGRHADPLALEGLGFFPQGMANRVRAVGNSSLAGAELLVGSADARSALVAWAGKVRNLDLASDAGFIQDFPAHMKFLWPGNDG